MVFGFAPADGNSRVDPASRLRGWDTNFPGRGDEHERAFEPLAHGVYPLDRAEERPHTDGEGDR